METVGLIPCAGKGTRLGLPFSKEMYPDVHGKEYRPIIMHTIDAFKLAGITEIIVTFNPDKRDILKYLGNGKQFGINISYCMHPTPKSLPESLNEAFHITKNKRVVFAMPDTIITPNNFVLQALNFHEKEGATVTLGCFKTDNPTSVSVVEFKENDSTVVNVIEKPKETNLKLMWGMMVWENSFSHTLNHFCNNETPRVGVKELYLSDALAPHIRNSEIKGIKLENGNYRDLGTFQEITRWANVKYLDSVSV
ncbi:NTP transferase domain-containing protein [Bacillus lacus]|uniref:Glucose-1-phosphate thymidylyltransferase n=1 Tax=Metabacillus lacus TaxID=1983721 RepID=A0A7X2IYX2_9BACI|nr:sugar phosphate nucleotidyltransferase [Metabacillus lacus]MRX72194.1 NTP transferase domain-containing protein [Metabacillus lacus]